MRHLAIITCLTFLFALGCDEKKDVQPAPPPKAATTAKPKPTPTKEPDAELDNEDIPVAEDYEEKAENEITETNFEEELAKLEKELEEDLKKEGVSEEKTN